mgnify:CR=1 FL=1
MITLRPHQITAVNAADECFARGATNVCMVQPTGSGKTIVKAEYARRSHERGEICFAFAHRDVLLSQISDAMCLMGVPHSFICADSARRDITNANHQKFGDSFFDETSPVVIVSVNTMAARLKAGKIPQQLLDAVKFWLLDETHHLTKESIWGKCIEPLKNARGLGVTATPLRGDKKGLGRHADGYFDEMTATSNMWALIQAGRLTPYKIFCPPNRVDLSGINVTSGGDYNQKKLASRVDKREITGDAVSHYLRVMPGQPVITFGVSIEHCKHIADEFNKAGIPSKAVSSKTPLIERNRAVDDLRNGRLVNLVNCDLFSEGFDAPAVVGVIMLRPTQSYSLFKQQMGRMLRPSEGKTHGILLDHVGNTAHMMKEYCLSSPHDDPDWTLDRGTKRKKNDDGKKLEDSTVCPECACFYLVKEHGDTCPDCGHTMTANENEAKKRELQVNEGELVELSVDAVDALIRERMEIDLPVDVFANTKAKFLPGVARNSALNNHAKRLHAQSVLRHNIQGWCTRYGTETGYSVDTVQREFQVRFGISVFAAQVLSERKALELTGRIQNGS